MNVVEAIVKKIADLCEQVYDQSANPQNYSQISVLTSKIKDEIAAYRKAVREATAGGE